MNEIIAMNGPSYKAGLDPKKMTDFEAGIYFLGAVDKLVPGITWGDLIAVANDGAPMMSGFNPFRAVGNLLGDAKDLVGETIRGAGGLIGDATRLITSDKVMAAAQAGAAAYATGGGSAALGGMFGGDGGTMGDVQNFLSEMGASFKKALGGSSGGAAKTDLAVSPWIWGGAIAGTAVLFLAFGGRRRG